MLERDLPITGPLVVCIPASMRTGQEKERWANQVSMFFAEFPIHLSDPVERLAVLRESMKAAKENFDAGPTHLVRDVMRFFPQTYWNVAVKGMEKDAKWAPSTQWNVVVSNVRGPAVTVHICDAEMLGYWPAAFLTPNIGLNITLQSYRGDIDFGFMGCPDLTPDLSDFPRYMEESLTELVAAGAPAKPAKTSSSPTAKKSAAKKATRPSRARKAAEGGSSAGAGKA